MCVFSVFGLVARRTSGAGWTTLVPGPWGCLAVLGLIGVWLKLGLRPQTVASPDPITPALLSHAQGIAQPAPLAQLIGKSLQSWNFNAVCFRLPGFCYFYGSRLCKSDGHQVPISLVKLPEFPAAFCSLHSL